jgi:phthiocerol/phenolphthiocerol synthesis type-I polyketide synthase E
MTSREDTAVIGMSCRLPDAPTIERFWLNLMSGRDSISHFTRIELAEAGVPAELLDDPKYVPARGYVDGADRFDPGYFGYSARDAALIDPQQRLLLECTVEALESAGWGSQSAERVGVYVSTSLSQYLLAIIMDPELRGTMDSFAAISAERDTAATRLSYKLNLTGPSVTIQSACSSSLVAVHMAIAALHRGDCDTAVVGGASLSVPLKVGYQYEEGGPFSPDGRSRTFDAQAAGTVPGNGAGVLVLRRLADAVAEGDFVLGVIKGSAVNNDGADKVGFTAPSISGQARAVRAAHAAAGVRPRSIGYVETHGTATTLGDPIEVAALAEAFAADGLLPRASTALGAVKTNIGHLDAAAGVAGLIKAVLCLQHGVLAPNVHFRSPNPLLELDRTPFYVPTEPTTWATGDTPRLAGITSLGIGGTNVHVIVEEYPQRARVPQPKRSHLVIYSGRSRAEMAEAGEQIRAAASGRLVGVPMADLGLSASNGRRHHEYRGFMVASSTRELASSDAATTRAMPGQIARAGGSEPRTVFVFPGAGAQYPGMAEGLYRSEPAFRVALDRCHDALSATTGVDLVGALFDPARTDQLTKAVTALPALFAVEYALVELLATWGIRPRAAIGHSMSEYVAATVAGVFTLEQVMPLMWVRGGLIAATNGGMIAVSLSAERLLPLLGDELDLAAINSTASAVASGPMPAVHALERRLTDLNVEFRRVRLNASGHSALIEPFLPAFRDAIKALPLAAPRIPFVSNMTGTWITDEQATDPEYWVQHLRQTVRFADGLSTLLDQPATLWVIGPGRTYLGWAGRATASARGRLLLSSLPESTRRDADRTELLTSLGRHWAAGGRVDWPAVYAAHQPRRVAMPNYPFQRALYWAPSGSKAWLTATTPRADAKSVVLAEHERPGLDVGYTAPSNDTERALATIWGELLGVDRLGIHDDFFELGGDSLLAVRIAAAVRVRLNTRTQPASIIHNRTVAALAAVLAADPRAGGAEADGTKQPDLAALAECGLRRLAKLSIPTPSRRRGGTVLLTGATGFLGPYLLRELLDQQPLPVSVLVRAADTESAHARVQAALAARSLWRPEYAARVTALPADLSAPKLGLAAPLLAELGRRLAAIYHCGAWVDFLRPYEQLAATNVAGTEAILHLAASAGAHLHHLSTVAVLTAGGAMGRGLEAVPERDLEPVPGQLASGYAQSKWVAERLVQGTADAGLPAATYRIGMLAGDSATGFCNHDDLFWRIILTCVQLGAFPDRPGAEISLVPVDRVAGALVALSTQQPTGVFHLRAPGLPWGHIGQWLTELGHSVRTMPFSAWLNEIVTTDRSLPVTPVAALLPKLLPERGLPPLSTAHTDDLLTGTGHDLPGLNRLTFTRSIDYLAGLAFNLRNRW